ncbi:hypothetical protein HGRIS_010307 [Hohenbuehelia grisea]|uniref:Uncharacterized protein n=1 Tax=Hohenbuehelia grisea TaxID=104357 RepID=A0ABR3J4J1_9AGAR
MAGFLPPYMVTQLDSSLPGYSFPRSFQVGRRTTAPFVTDAQLRGHLALLRVFSELKERVEADADLNAYFESNMPDASDTEAFRQKKWAAFVAVAVERFERWYNTISSMDEFEFRRGHFPPVDVMMVWHAYLLNPGWYAEDCARLPNGNQLRALGEILAGALSSFEGNYTGEMTHDSELSRSRWYMRTETVWDPLRGPREMKTKPMTCPGCARRVQAAFMNKEGTGYAQASFSLQCACGMEITRDKLGALKFVLDIVRDDDTHRSFLAGTVQSPISNPIGTYLSPQTLVRASLFKDTFVSSRVFARPKRKGSHVSESEWIKQIMKRMKSSISTVNTKLSTKLKPNIRQHVLSAYTDDRMFSVELVGAVLRQGSFTKKMNDLQWTLPGYFSSSVDAIALQHAIARYHAFMDLMTGPGAFLVPTLDIDLAWHTHQLMATAYGTDCKEVLGKFIDHDDKISENNLATAYDMTCKAWKQRFGQAYSHCGCPLPGDSIGTKLQRLIGIRRERIAPSYLIPPDEPNLLAATHPSDHNAVFPFHHRGEGEAARKRRRAKYTRRQRRAAEQAQRDRGDERGNRYVESHQAAFLTPVPIYYGSYACVAASGNVVTSGGGTSGASGGGGGSTCASGSGGCGAGCPAACSGLWSTRI